MQSSLEVRHDAHGHGHGHGLGLGQFIWMNKSSNGPGSNLVHIDDGRLQPQSRDITPQEFGAPSNTTGMQNVPRPMTPPVVVT